MLLRRALNLLKFFLERWLLRGTFAQLLVIAGVLGLVSLAGGLALHAFDQSEGTGGAVWWAFLRLSDPGYLGDDQGVGRRIVSTLLTVAGYVLFMGSLVAIMTQWLNRKMRELESGFTPIALEDHVVVIGWTSRTAVIAREMFLSVARVKRFLSLYDARVLRLVFLLEHLNAEIRYALRQRVGPPWRERHVTMRSGSALQLEDLMRADVAHAAAILVPSEDFGPSEGAADARTVKTLASLRHHLDESQADDLPLVVTELFDAQKLSIARRAYPGPLELVCSDQLIGRLLALTVLHPGLSSGIDELLTFADGNEVHVVDAPELVGNTIERIRRRLPEALCLGFVGPDGRSFKPRLCPPPEATMSPDDRLVVVARSSEAAKPSDEVDSASESPHDEHPPSRSSRLLIESVLVAGWSDRVPDLVRELHAHHGGHLRVEVLSAIPVKEREAELEVNYAGVEVTHRLGDVTRRSVVARCLEQRFDRIVLAASDWVATGAHSDARTVLTYLLFRDELTRRGRETPMVVELMERANRPLVRDPQTEALVSPQIIGRVLAQVTLRRELRAIYDDLFDADGPAICLRSAPSYGLPAEEQSFTAIARVVARGDDVLLGIVDEGTTTVNPPQDSRWNLARHPTLIVLGRPETALPRELPASAAS